MQHAGIVVDEIDESTVSGVLFEVRLLLGSEHAKQDFAITDGGVCFDHFAGEAGDLQVIDECVEQRRRTGLGKLIMGSVAEGIFRTVTCPVLTVGPHSDPSHGAGGTFREILYATDFSPESKGAAAYAVSLAQEFQSRLILLHVIPERKAGDLVCAADVMTSSKELLRKLLPPEADAWCQPEYFVELGDPVEKILEFANGRETDLIVLGVRPEKGVPGAATHLPIAIAHKIVSRATCPVLTVRH